MRLLLIPLLLLVANSVVHATSCFGPMTVCSSYSGSSLVFRGRVISVETPNSPCQSSTYPDGTVGFSCVAMMQETVRFSMLELFKGPTSNEVSLTTGPGEFKVGSEYIVFAGIYAKTQQLVTSVCSGNRSLDDAGAAGSLAWLRAYATAPPTVRIFGSTIRPSGITDYPAIHIDLAGEGRNLSTTTQSDHTYEFRDLPPGSYTLTAAIPSAYMLPGKNSVTITVEPKGCQEVDWFLQDKTHLGGTVRDSAGNPAPHVLVGLLQPTQNRLGFQPAALAEADDTGRYTLSGFLAGDYWIATNPNGPSLQRPYLTGYYPTGGPQQSAALVHLDATSSRDDADLQLAPPMQPVVVRLSILNPDGSPAVKAHVAAVDPDDSMHFMPAQADDLGNAAITLFKGRTYRLIANTAGYRTPECGGPVQFVAADGIHLGTITLDKAFTECRRLQQPPK